MALSPVQLPAWLPRPTDLEIAALTAYPNMVVRQKQIKAEYQSDALAVQRLLDAGQAVPTDVRTSLLKRLQLINQADKTLASINKAIQGAVDQAVRLKLLSYDDVKGAGLGALPFALVLIIVVAIVGVTVGAIWIVNAVRDVKLAQDQIEAQRPIVAAFVERVKATPIDQDVRVPDAILPQSRRADIPGPGLFNSLFSSFGSGAGLGTVLLLGVGLYLFAGSRRRAA